MTVPALGEAPASDHASTPPEVVAVEVVTLLTVHAPMPVWVEVTVMAPMAVAVPVMAPTTTMSEFAGGVNEAEVFAATGVAFQSRLPCWVGVPSAMGTY